MSDKAHVRELGALRKPAMDLGEYLLSDEEESHDEQSRSPGDTRRKPSLSSLGRKLAAVASTVGGAIARSAEAAAEVRCLGC